MTKRAQRPKRGCIMRLVRLVMLAVVFVAIGAAAVTVYWYFSDQERRQRLDDLTIESEEHIMAFRRMLSEKWRQVLGPEHTEKVKQLTDQAVEQVKGWTESMSAAIKQRVVQELGPRSEYSKAYSEFDKAGGTSPNDLDKKGAIDRRLAELDHLENVRSLTLTLLEQDKHLLTLRRKVLELVKDHRGAWTVEPQAKTVKFENADAQRQYDKLISRINELLKQQAETTKQLRPADPDYQSHVEEPLSE